MASLNFMKAIGAAVLILFNAGVFVRIYQNHINAMFEEGSPSGKNRKLIMATILVNSFSALVAIAQGYWG